MIQVNLDQNIYHNVTIDFGSFTEGIVATQPGSAPSMGTILRATGDGPGSSTSCRPSPVRTWRRSAAALFVPSRVARGYFTYTDQNGNLQHGVVIINIGPGEETPNGQLEINGSVAPEPRMARLDVFGVQQRLKYLGFLGYGPDFPTADDVQSKDITPGGVELTVNGLCDGTIDDPTVQAIRLFQATIARTTPGRTPSSPPMAWTGVDPGGPTEQWLASTMRPRWEKLTPNGTFQIKDGLNRRRFTGRVGRWISSTRQPADQTLTIPTTLTGQMTINGISDEYGDTNPFIHATHKAGLDIDVNIAKTCVEQSIANAQANGRPQSPPPGMTNAWYISQLTDAEKQVVNNIMAFYYAAGKQFHLVYVGGWKTVMVNGTSTPQYFVTVQGQKVHEVSVDQYSADESQSDQSAAWAALHSLSRAD